MNFIKNDYISIHNNFKKNLILLFIIFTTALNIKAQPEGVLVDGVVAVVGKHIVLFSELESHFLQAAISSQADTENLKCEILEELMLQKLLLSQAEYDSVTVSDNEVESELDRRMRFFIAQIGSREALEEYYNKSITSIKDEFRDLIREQMLVQKMQQDITSDIRVTPTEVRRFFNSLTEEEIPHVELEFELFHLLVRPEITSEQKDDILRKMTELRNRIIKGDQFSALAVLYSEDPGSARKGGELGFFERGDMFPEFEAASFRLQTPGEVSSIIETKAGFHIIQLIERRGELINVRHILLQLKPSPYEIQSAKNSIDSLYNLLINNTITFEDALKKFSDSETSKSKAMMINPHTMNNTFAASHLDGSTLIALENSKAGGYTRPLFYKTPEGTEAFRIIYVANTIPPHKANLKDDYALLHDLALENKKQQKISEWINEKKRFIYMKIDDQFKDCLFAFDW